MLIEYTKKEEQEIQRIREKFIPKLQECYTKLAKTKDREKRNVLLIEATLHTEQMQNELHAYIDTCQRKRFDRFKGDPARIISNAREQAPQILKNLQADLQYQNRNSTPEFIKELQLGQIKNGNLLVSATLATDTLKDEFKLHLSALADNLPAQQELLGVIIEAVKNSPYTDKTELFRRGALSKINTYGMMNDIVNNYVMQTDADIFEQETNGQYVLKWNIDQTPNSKISIPTLIALTYEGEDEKNPARKMSGYEKRVYDAVGTIYYYWHQKHPDEPLYISPREIWRVMNGKYTGDPSEGAIRRLCKTMDKFRFTRLQMDISAEITANKDRNYNDERINNGYIETYLLQSDKAEFLTEKNTVISGYRLEKEPMWYWYNRVKNRLLYIPFEMLDTSKYTSDVENVAEIKGYLLQQIQLMKNYAEDLKKNKKTTYFKRNNIILIDSIYTSTGILTPEERAEETAFNSDNARATYIRKTRAADREKIEGMFKAWKEKKWIRNYVPLNKDNQPAKDKQPIKGYKIYI